MPPRRVRTAAGGVAAQPRPALPPPAAPAAPPATVAPLLDELPGDVVLHLLLLVPIDERLALRIICKSWTTWLRRAHSAGCCFAQARTAPHSARAASA